MTRFVLAFAAALLATASAAGERSADPEQPSAAWVDLAEALYPDRAIADTAGMIEIDAPFRAQDAGAMPVEIAIVPPLGRVVERFALVIDENPAPVAAQVEVGPGMGREVRFATRLRVDAYSNIRVVAELDDGSVAQSARFVRASGGCSAPASADPNAEIADLGRIDLRAVQAERPTAEMQVRHPNHSGFQVDQVSLLNIPAWFVDFIEVRQGDQLVMRVVGGISLSENPSLRFGYVPNGAGAFEVRVEDTEGGVFESAFPLVSG
jgi:sulfur-oxidizing protein SoxY